MSLFHRGSSLHPPLCFLHHFTSCSLHGHVFTFCFFLSCISNDWTNLQTHVFLWDSTVTLDIGWLHTAFPQLYIFCVVFCNLITVGRGTRRKSVIQRNVGSQKHLAFLQFNTIDAGFRIVARLQSLGACCRNVSTLHDLRFKECRAATSGVVFFPFSVFSSAEPWSLMAQIQSSSSAFHIHRGCLGFMWSSLSRSLLWFITFTSVRHLQHCELEEIVAMWPDLLSRICTRWFRAPGADHFSSSVLKASVRKQAESPFESTESKAVFSPVWLLNGSFFQRKHPEYGFFSGTPLQKETQNVVIVWQREGLLPLSRHCMKPAPFDVFPPYRRTLIKASLSAVSSQGEKPRDNLALQEGSKQRERGERGGERGGRPRGGREDETNRERREKMVDREKTSRAKRT